MAEPFQQRSAGRDGFFSRLFGGGAKGNTMRELEQLLAQAERVGDVTPQRVSKVAAAHGVNLRTQLRKQRKSLYRRFLNHCLTDNALSEQENADLAHLRSILKLQDEDAVQVHDEVARFVYGKAIEQVLEDQRLDRKEEAFLKRLRDDLQIDEPLAQEMLAEGALRTRQRYLAKAVSHNVLVDSGETVLELTGTSEASVEDAVRSAIAEASRAIPNLRRVKVADVEAAIEDGKFARWHVKLQVVIKAAD